MTASPEASAFTETLLSTVRLQRHLGTRILVSTQEPTVSEALLDLSSIIVVHRFTSPQWIQSLRRHLAPVASELAEDVLLPEEVAHHLEDNRKRIGTRSHIKVIFREIVNLTVGEALIFSPTAAVGCERSANGKTVIRRLGLEYVKIKIRARLTTDGGRSILAN